MKKQRVVEENLRKAKDSEEQMLRNASILKHISQKNQAVKELMATKLGKKVISALASHFRMIQTNG